jgi:pimeloyl-ACP methyl ester carboxylesterase
MSRIAHRGGRRRAPVFGRDDSGLAIDLVVTRTEDGQSWDGMIYRPAAGGDPLRRRLAVLVVHGSVGNYITGIPRRVSFGLAQAGFTVMSVNTRMANYGVIFGGGLMHRTPLDIDAALEVLRRRGFRRVVLLGFSMGSTMVTHYQALRRPTDVVGVLTLAHPASLPAALRLRWDHFGAEPGYEEVAELVHRRLAPDFEDASRDRILLVRRARGFGDRPLDCEVWSLRTWWHSRGPRAPHAESRLRVGHVTVPLGIVQAAEDELVRDDEGPELEALARQGDCPSVWRTTVPDADHVFTGCDDDLIEACVGWLDGRVEASPRPARDAAG